MTPTLPAGRSFIHSTGATRLFARLRALMLLAGLAVPLQAVAAGTPAPASPAAPARAAATAPAPRLLVWEVTRPGVPAQRAWLFGTVHVGKASFYPLPAPVMKAFGEAGALAVEADVTLQPALEKATAMMLYTPPASLASVLPAPLVKRLRAQCSRLGMPFEALQAVKPFPAAGLLIVGEYSRQGMEQEQGLDLHFIQKAKEVSKPVLELEGLEEQARIVTSMSLDDEEAFLDNALASLESGEAGRLINKLVAAWQAGDAAGLAQLLDESSQGMNRRKEVEEILIHTRNRTMATRIDALIKAGKRPFVAVGAAHLVGPTGLVRLLSERGYTVRQM